MSGPNRHPAKSCPPVLVRLLKKVDYSFSQAGRLAGVSPSYIGGLARGDVKYKPTEDSLARIAHGLKIATTGKGSPLPVRTHGEARHGKTRPKGNGELGIVICFPDNKTLERLWTTGEAMGGSWVYKKRQQGGRWMLILKLPEAKQLAAFASAATLAGEVVTP